MRTRVRAHGLVLLLALLGVQLATLGAAFAGDPVCLCDENMCTHHPKGHGSHDHGSHASHDAAAPTAHRPASPSADHCAYQPVLVDTGNCSMRGCDHQGEESLPVTTLGSLPDPTSIARPEGVSVLASGAIGSPLDRSSLIEPPPPRFLSV